jgi:hypothetical protein
MAKSLGFFQVYYDEGQLGELYDFAQPFYNQSLTPYFENDIIAHIVPKCDADLIGVASWRLRKKRGDCAVGLKNSLHLSAEKIIDTDADVCILTPRSPIHKPLLAAENWHGKAWVEAFGIFKGYLRSIGIKVPGELVYSIYENHFVAKREIYHEYVEKVLKPSIQFMEDEPIFLTPSGYIKLKRNAPDTQRVTKMLGLKDWPIGVFILERLFSIWINNKGFNVKPV